MRRVALPLVVLLTVTGLAGCLSGTERDPVVADDAATTVETQLFGLGLVVDAAVPLPDGVRARGTVYLPNVTEGTKVPVIMDLGPYYGNSGHWGGLDTGDYDAEFPPNLLYHHFLQRGYAVALMSLRGTGLSGGCFDIGGPREMADAAAIVEWLAAQDWSDGTVAMTGISYDGTTPWEAAVTGTPSLKAIVPVEGISDMYRYSFYEGVPAYLGGGTLFHTYYMPLVDWGYTGTSRATTWAPTLSTNVCPETVRVISEPYKTWRDGVHGPFWDERDMSAMLDRITAATYVVHGFQDWNVKPDNVQFLWDDLPDPKRMLLGQWRHNTPWRSSLGRDWDFSLYNDTVTQWFDAFVRNDPAARAAALAAPPVMAQDSRGVWWNLSRWPPAESVMLPLHLGPRRALLAEPSNETADYRFAAQVNRGTAMPTAGGLFAPSTLTLESATLRAPLHLMGNPEATFTVSVDRPAGYLNAHLYDVNSVGVRTEITPGFVNLLVREDRDRSTAVPVNTPFEVHVKFYALSHVLEAGHTLELVLESSDPSLNPVQPEPVTFTVHVGGDRTGALRLPVFAGALPGSAA